MTAKKVYLSGGITGVVNPYERFQAASQLMLQRGLDPISPYSIPPCSDGSCVEGPHNPRSDGHTWACWLRHDLIVLLQCDEVATLPGWQQSRGSVLEVSTALSVGIPVSHLSPIDIGE